MNIANQSFRSLIDPLTGQLKESSHDIVLLPRYRGGCEALCCLRDMKFLTLDQRKNRHVAVTAAARELCGFTGRSSLRCFKESTEQDL